MYDQRRSGNDYDRVEDSYDSTMTSSTSTYRSAMSPRVTNVQRPRSSAIGGGGGVTTRMYQSIQSSGGGNFAGGLASLANFPGVPMRGGAGGSMALVGLNTNRQREKRDLVQLNDKFAQYVEKVRFLEAQNRKLMMELEALQGRTGQGSSRIKEMYDIETGEAKRLIDETKRDAAAANVKTQQAEQEVKKQRARYEEVSKLRDKDRQEVDAIQKKVAENEAQIALFRRRIADLEDEGNRFKSQAQRLSSEVSRLQHEIQNERFLKSSSDVEKLALEDEMATLKQMHEADLADMRSASVSNDLDPSQFFRNELAQAIREIRNDYENVVDNQRSDLQNRFSMMYNEIVMRQQQPGGSGAIQSEQQLRQEKRIREELLQTQNQNGYLKATNEDIRNRIADLERKVGGLREDGSLAQARLAKEIEEAKRRLEQVNKDFQDVTNMKTSLEKEIGTYRDLLEGQTGLRGYVDRIVQSAEQQALDRPMGGGGGGGGGGAGGSTSISRTMISSSGSNYGYGSSSGAGGISSLVSQSSRPSNSYQTISTGVKSTLRDSGASDSYSRGRDY